VDNTVTSIWPVGQFRFGNLKYGLFDDHQHSKQYKRRVVNTVVLSILIPNAGLCSF
jgi:hypothetical protein